MGNWPKVKSNVAVIIGKSPSYELNHTKCETQAKEGSLPLNSLEESLLFIAKNFKR